MVLYPPNLTSTQQSHILTSITDFQITHGSLLKLPAYSTPTSTPSRPISCAVFPTVFPRSSFEVGRRLTGVFGKLYSCVAEDEEWLGQILGPVIKGDGFVRLLWGIHQAVKEDERLEEAGEEKVGCRRRQRQQIQMGVWRGDYMLRSAKETELKQVEFNTFSVAGGTHGDIVGGMHRFLAKSVYEFETWGVGGGTLPSNETLKGIVGALAKGVEAHGMEGNSKCVLMVVQPYNVNICDERPIEYGLWDRGIPTYRVEFGTQLLEQTRVDGDGKLMFMPKLGVLREIEVAVVYWRAGYEELEYDDDGVECRRRVEGSRAIKCPSILAHLGTLKVVQRALALAENLKRFLTEEEVDMVRSVCMDMFVLDESEEGKKARDIVMDGERVGDWVLKPNKEGGGHGVFGVDIPVFLEEVPMQEWGNYVLMKRIVPPKTRGMLMDWEGLYEGDVVSELGIFGGCIWRVNRVEGDQDGETAGQHRDKVEVLMNEELGFSFKTKRADVDEMSVVKGHGCFDSPLLI